MVQTWVIYVEYTILWTPGRYIRKSGGMLLPRVRLMLEADTGRCATIGAQRGAQGARALSWGAVGAALSRYN